jgi:predicted Fe-S protein YdhL (DUF1289 family)
MAVLLSEPRPDAKASALTVETPCIDVCVIDEASRLCQGCRRTIAEIARWAAFSPEERRRIMAELPGRRAVATPRPRSC